MNEEKIVAKKVTKKDNFKALLELTEVKTNKNFVEFIEKEIANLEKKSASNGKLTKNQEANIALAETVFKVLESESKAMTVSEIQKASAELAEFSNQKLSAILNRNLVAEGKVIKTIEKGKTLFAVAVE